MSLPRNEDVQQTETTQERAFFTREKLHKEVERLKRQNSSPHTSQELRSEYDPEEVPTPTLPQGLDNIKAKVGKLLEQSGANTQESKKDERVLLMAAAVLEMCQLLTNFLESMNREMERLNESAKQNLNLQEQYVKSVETTTHQAVGNIYHNLKAQEKEAINDLMQYVEANSSQMEKDITACTENVKSATKAAESASAKIAKSVERFRKIKTFRDFLYCSAPVFVAVDIILRVVALATHIS